RELAGAEDVIARGCRRVEVPIQRVRQPRVEVDAVTPHLSAHIRPKAPSVDVADLPRRIHPEVPAPVDAVRLRCHEVGTCSCVDLKAVTRQLWSGTNQLLP